MITGTNILRTYTHPLQYSSVKLLAINIGCPKSPTTANISQRNDIIIESLMVKSLTTKNIYLKLRIKRLPVILNTVLFYLNEKGSFDTSFLR